MNTLWYKEENIFYNIFVSFYFNQFHISEWNHLFSVHLETDYAYAPYSLGAQVVLLISWEIGDVRNTNFSVFLGGGSGLALILHPHELGPIICTFTVQIHFQHIHTNIEFLRGEDFGCLGFSFPLVFFF